jgi:hypothetical protein
MSSSFGLSGTQSASLGVDSFVVHNRAASEGDEYSFTWLYRTSPSGFFEASYPLPSFLTISSQADLRFTIYDLRFAICDLRFAICDESDLFPHHEPSSQRIPWHVLSDLHHLRGSRLRKSW